MKNLLLAFILLSGSMRINAQFNFDARFDTYDIFGTQTQTELIATGYVKNTSGGTETFLWQLSENFPSSWVFAVTDKNQMHGNSVTTGGFNLNDGDSGIIELRVAPMSTSGGAEATFSFSMQSDPFDIVDAPLTFNVWATSVPEVASIKTAQVYPNPANGTITLSLPVSHLLTFFVYNTLGQQVLQQNYTGIAGTIDITQLPAGVYYLQYADDEGMEQQIRFIKQ